MIVSSTNKLNIYGYDDNWDVHFVKEFMDGLPQFGITPTFINKKKYSRHITYPYLRRCIIIENEDESFYIINHCDGHTSYNVFHNAMNDVKCLKVFQCQFRKGDNHEKVSPFTYLEKNALEFRKLSPNYRNCKKTSDRLFFHGDLKSNDNRKKRAEVIPLLDDILISNWSELVNHETFLKEMAESRIALSIPGNSNFCHKEIEGFGLGVAVLMPKLLNSYYNDLIPNHHYISVDINWEMENSTIISKAIQSRFSEVKNDHDFLNSVVSNGFHWYEHNVLTPSPTRIFLEETDLFRRNKEST